MKPQDVQALAGCQSIRNLGSPYTRDPAPHDHLAICHVYTYIYIYLFTYSFICSYSCMSYVCKGVCVYMYISFTKQEVDIPRPVQSLLCTGLVMCCRESSASTRYGYEESPSGKNIDTKIRTFSCPPGLQSNPCSSSGKPPNLVRRNSSNRTSGNRVGRYYARTYSNMKVASQHPQHRHNPQSA